MRTTCLEIMKKSLAILSYEQSEKGRGRSPPVGHGGDVVEGPRCCQAAASTAVPSLQVLMQHKELAT